ncbi:hypothetical protein PV332_10360 [Streptomyces scabiei]|uniref:hypothetical protein n=1 Tax=Streptomyces scabiei TaxID=1930 RepID=UPI0029BF0835|nr:hypothetical protein [Streptomyces scabiei]MDX2575882.1 hypothetical protein [Streptomyces scabiei]MDX2885645.1 hypothetical protein [Streptomyces scabiei]MDX2998007.1 hypothetical protein [Streptomyces scabiei]MDX3033443.1 hypothetical protein [Streptomyces scabiei]MDX3051622.1 hypothetical protein [Streptomyces scabiei]
MSGAHVVLEEADDTGEDGVIVTRVYVNGVDVGRLAKAPKISVGHERTCTTVMLTLVPSRLEIKGERADGERREPRAGFAAKID